MSVRTRFAPSPTGYLHVGGARTALFSWLWARHHGGVFVLRIEDTDRERSTQEAIDAIYHGMRWLGLDWDEGPDVGGPYGPYLQTARHEIHLNHINNLAASDLIYPCYSTRDELKVQREAARKSGDPLRYQGRDDTWDIGVVRREWVKGQGPALMLKVPQSGVVAWTDLIKGPIQFDFRSIDDFIIVRGDGTPTYNFAVTLDDADMKITHVVRGDDHVSNTPKQLLLYDLLGVDRPQFGHVPMIVGQDGAKLSKRHGATAVGAYKDQGYISDAMINYLALLGWALDDKTEVFTRDELIHHFTLDRVGSTPSAFDVQKLSWMNGVQLRAMSVERRTQVVGDWLEKHGLWPQAGKGAEFLEQLVTALGDRIKLLGDVEEYGSFALTDTVEYDPKAVKKVLKGPKVVEVLSLAMKRLQASRDFTESSIEAALKPLAEELELKMGQVFQPLRVGVTGKTISPGIYDTLALLGKERSVSRLQDFQNHIQAVNTG